MQTFGPWRTRHLPAIFRIRLHLSAQAPRARQHRMLDKCASYPRPSALLCLSSSTRLRSNEQTAVGIFSLLNDYRISVGLGPFGWINPWLYGVGSFGFNDITSGHNPGCGTEGFEATDGGGILFVLRGFHLFVFDFANSERRRSPVKGRRTFSS